MTDSIFTTENPQTTDTTGEAAKLQVVLPDSVRELIGEGKKYASVELALAALTPAQQHIAKLEAENADLRTKASSGASTEEVLRAIEALGKSKEDGTPPAAPLALDETKVTELLTRVLTARETATLHAQNEAAVGALLTEKYKDKAKEHFEGRAKELGMSPVALSTLVRTTPSAAMELLGLKPAGAARPNPSKGSINAEAFSSVPRTDSQPRKSVMFGAKTSDMVDAWRAAKPTDA
jgi:hypothetical protein